MQPILEAHDLTKVYDLGGTHVDAHALAETLEDVHGAVFQVRGFVSEKPDVQYLSVDLRVASATPIPRP